MVDLDVNETDARAVERRLRAVFGGRTPNVGQKSARYAAKPLESGQRRLECLVGKPVLTANRRCLGRLEEVCAERVGGNCVVTAYLLGSAGMLQRLGLGVIGVEPRGHVAGWRQLDLAADNRLVLNCSPNELGQD